MKSASLRHSERGGHVGLNGLPPADEMVLRYAHHRYGANTLTSLDGALKNERQPNKVDKHLDMYSPSGGYDPDGSEYSPTFVPARLPASPGRAHAAAHEERAGRHRQGCPRRRTVPGR
ncbi:hypothetical protein Psi02_54200 [Planotetraspora silvatica]|uniref:Uncharacterized protein n=1 Tax=Planotetraspora silvatica TaxID=234614 RepID=A0A8J3XR19_9ACTN|nr:hypothetical protein Psi02_54200 [Planotetraspora silvatica]